MWYVDVVYVAGKLKGLSGSVPFEPTDHVWAIVDSLVDLYLGASLFEHRSKEKGGFPFVSGGTVYVHQAPEILGHALDADLFQ